MKIPQNPRISKSYDLKLPWIINPNNAKTINNPRGTAMSAIYCVFVASKNLLNCSVPEQCQRTDNLSFIVPSMHSTLTRAVPTQTSVYLAWSNSKSANGGIMFKKNTGRAWDARNCIRNALDDAKKFVIDESRDKVSCWWRDAKSSLLIKRHLRSSRNAKLQSVKRCERSRSDR